MNNEYLKKSSIILNHLDNIGELIDNDNDYSKYYYKNQLLRYYNTLMIVKENLKPGKVLDIGSYPSHIHKALLMMDYDAYGVDIDPNRISSNLNDCRKKTYKADIESSNWEIGNNDFDIIFILEVVEHLHVNPFIVFHKIEHLLKIGGLLFLSTPNLFSLANRIKFIRGQYVFEHPFGVYEKLERHNSRGHQRLYSIEEISDILDVYGFDVIKKWCVNDSSPVINQAKIAGFLNNDFDFDKFSAFWHKSFSWKGKLRLKLEKMLNRYFYNYYNSIYIIAKKSRPYDESKIIKKIQKSDPMVSVDKFKLK